MLATHARMIDDLVRRTGLDRALEGLPGPEAIAERAAAGTGLCSPELAVLLAHVKLDLKAEILRTDVPDLPELAELLAAQFPTQLAGRFPEAVATHPLRREIVATALVNELVNRGGITFAHRLAEDVAGTPADVVRAFRVATHDLRAARALVGVAALPVTVPVGTVDGIALESRRLLDDATRWLLAHRPRPLAVGAESVRFGPPVRALLPTLPVAVARAGGHRGRRPGRRTGRSGGAGPAGPAGRRPGARARAAGRDRGRGAGRASCPWTRSPGSTSRCPSAGRPRPAGSGPARARPRSPWSPYHRQRVGAQ